MSVQPARGSAGVAERVDGPALLRRAPDEQEPAPGQPQAGRNLLGGCPWRSWPNRSPPGARPGWAERDGLAELRLCRRAPGGPRRPPPLGIATASKPVRHPSQQLRSTNQVGWRANEGRAGRDEARWARGNRGVQRFANQRTTVAFTQLKRAINALRLHLHRIDKKKGGRPPLRTPPPALASLCSAGGLTTKVLAPLRGGPGNCSRLEGRLLDVEAWLRNPVGFFGSFLCSDAGSTVLLPLYRLGNASRAG
jgi:hypothetical protein